MVVVPSAVLEKQAAPDLSFLGRVQTSSWNFKYSSLDDRWRRF